MLTIYEVIKSGKTVALELTDGRDTWFYAYDQGRYPSLRIGKFPNRSAGESQRQTVLTVEFSSTQLVFRTPHIQPLAKTSRIPPTNYEEIGAQIGRLVTEKQVAYGDSFGKSGDVLRILYPDGIKTDQYDDALAVVRIVDKLFRIANKKDAFGESPYKDIVGYAILGVGRVPEINPSLKAGD